MRLEQELAKTQTTWTSHEMAERATEQGWKEGPVMKIVSVKTQERWEENTKAGLKVKVREGLYVVEGGNPAGESVKSCT